MYDASGQRYAKIEQPTEAGTSRKAQATVYLGDTELTDPDVGPGNGTVTAVRYVTFGGSTVAVMEHKKTGAAKWFYLFGDFQGSAQLMMPDGDPAVQAANILRNAYTPYGAGRSYDFDGTGAAALSTERGWLSQVADEATATLGTGLTYLNARYYDPAASRFLTPDPLMDVMDPKTLDPYRYADNNPVAFTDATGLCTGLSGDEMAKCAQGWQGSRAHLRDVAVKAGLKKAFTKDFVKIYAGALSAPFTLAAGVGAFTVKTHPIRMLVDPKGYFSDVGDRASAVGDVASDYGNTFVHFWSDIGDGDLAGAGKAWADWAWSWTGKPVADRLAVGDTYGAANTLQMELIATVGKAALTRATRAISTAANTAVTTTRTVDDVLSGLPRGNQSFVRTVPDEAALSQTFAELTEGATPTTWSNYAGQVFERSDRVQVGMRTSSSSGGATIDIRIPGVSQPWKVHIAG